MDLRHPERKMSKSEPNSCLFLNDEDYEHKIMKAVTNPEGLANLINIYKTLDGDSNLLPSIDNKTLKQLIIQLYENHFLV